MARDPGEFIDTQQGSGGGPVGPRLKGSLFVPAGMGIVFTDANGGFWQTQITVNADGSASLTLVPVNF